MSAKVNKIELSEKDYQGAPSSMCQGCGHDAISASIRKAFTKVVLIHALL